MHGGYGAAKPAGCLCTTAHWRQCIGITGSVRLHTDANDLNRHHRAMEGLRALLTTGDYEEALLPNYVWALATTNKQGDTYGNC